VSDYKADYINYRVTKSSEALNDAKVLANNQSWNACINRLYYACYYAVSALLLQNNVTTLTHTGLKTQFNLHFIKTGLIDKNYGKLFADLMDWRQKGDYGDMFDFDEDAVKPLIHPVESFIGKIKTLINS
jgi:uncharacterized protein (UPF0332 family)